MRADSQGMDSSICASSTEIQNLEHGIFVAEFGIPHLVEIGGSSIQVFRGYQFAANKRFRRFRLLVDTGVGIEHRIVVDKRIVDLVMKSKHRVFETVGCGGETMFD